MLNNVEPSGAHQAREFANELRASTKVSRSTGAWLDSTQGGAAQGAGGADTSTVSEAYAKMLRIFIPLLVDEVHYHTITQLPPQELSRFSEEVFLLLQFLSSSFGILHRAYTCHDMITVCNHIYGWFCIVCFLCCKVWLAPHLSCAEY